MNAKPSLKNISEKNLGWGSKTIRTYLIRFVVILITGFVVAFAMDIYRLQQPEFQMARSAVLGSELVAHETGGIRYVERTASEFSEFTSDTVKTASYTFFVRGESQNLYVTVDLNGTPDGEFTITSLNCRKHSGSMDEE